MAWGKTSFTRSFKPATKSKPVTRRVTSYRPPTSPPQSETVRSPTNPKSRTLSTVTSRAPAPKTAKNIVTKAPVGRVTSPIPAVTRPAVRVVPKSVIAAVTTRKTGAPSGGTNTAKSIGGIQKARAASIAQGIQQARAKSIAQGIQRAAQQSKAKTIANAVAATRTPTPTTRTSTPTTRTPAPVVKPPTVKPVVKPPGTTAGPTKPPVVAKPGAQNVSGGAYTTLGGTPQTFGAYSRKRLNRGPLTGQSVTPEELRRIAAQRIVNR